MNNLASLQRGIAQAEAYKARDRKGFITHDPVDIKAIRTANNMTQAQFADTFHLPIGTVRDWEQGRRAPEGPARVLLHLIAREPNTIKRIMAGA